MSGIINGEPTIEKLHLSIHQELSLKMIACLNEIAQKNDWQKEPIYLDGIPKKLTIGSAIFQWNMTSNNAVLNELDVLISAIVA